MRFRAGRWTDEIEPLVRAEPAFYAMRFAPRHAAENHLEFGYTSPARSLPCHTCPGTLDGNTPQRTRGGFQ